MDDFAVAQCEDAVKLTFRTLFQLEVTLTDVQRFYQYDASVRYEVATFMNIVQDHLIGAIVLGCSYQVLEPIVSPLLGGHNQRHVARESWAR